MAEYKQYYKKACQKKVEWLRFLGLDINIARISSASEYNKVIYFDADDYYSASTVFSFKRWEDVYVTLRAIEYALQFPTCILNLDDLA